MIDTIKVSTAEYQIDTDNSLTVDYSLQPSSGELTEYSNNLLFFQGMKPIYGKRAYRNTDTFQADIWKGKLLVKCSIPKNYSITKANPKGVNYYPVGIDGTHTVLKKLQQELQQEGIRIDIEKCTVSRLDIFKNVEVEHTTSDYFPMLESLEGKRQQKRLYGTTVLFMNSQQQTCFYDKVAEMELKGGCSLRGYKDTLRAEYRLMKPRKIRKALSLETGTVAEVLDCYSNLGKQYRNHIETDIMKYEVPEYLQLLSSELERDFMQAYSQGCRQWLGNYMKEQGYRNLLKEQTIEGVLKAYARTLEVNGQDNIKQKVYSLKRLLQAYNMKLVFSSATEHNTTYRSLYKELKEKLCC